MPKHISFWIKKYFQFHCNTYRLIHLQREGFVEHRHFVPMSNIIDEPVKYGIDNLWAKGEFFGHEEMPVKFHVGLN